MIEHRQASTTKIWRLFALVLATAGLLIGPAFGAESLISDYIDPSLIPTSALEPLQGINDLITKVGISDLDVHDLQVAGQSVGTEAQGKLSTSQALEFKLPGLDAFKLMLQASSQTSFTLKLRDAQGTGTTYPMELEIKSLDVRLRLKSGYVHPVKVNAGKVTEYACNQATGECLDNGAAIYPDITTTGTIVFRLTWDGDVQMEVKADSGGTPTFNILTPLMVGETGLVISASDIILDLSDTDTPAAVGLGPDWRGIYFKTLDVQFSGAMAGAKAGGSGGLTGISLTAFSIGKGGVSGTIRGVIPTSASATIKLGDADFKLKSVDIELKQNSFVHSRVSGTIDPFPFFEKSVDLDLAIDDAGKITAMVAATDRDANGLKTFQITNVLDFKVDSLSVEIAGKTVDLTLNGTATPTFQGALVMPSGNPDIAINGLRISSDGKIELKGGWPTLPHKATFKAAGIFKLEVSQFAFGTEPAIGATPAKQWIGFTGALDMEKLGGSAKFDELKFAWEKGSSSVRASIKGIDINFERKGVITFEGKLASFEGSGRCGFAGHLKVNLQKLGIETDSDVLVGRAAPGNAGACGPDDPGTYKFFYVDLEVFKSSGIPVFGNVAIYSFSGLFAGNMGPDIYAFNTPLDWYHAHTKSTDVLAPPSSPCPPSDPPCSPPWKTDQGSYALGAGLLLGTQSDAGYAVNVQAALLLVTPGPVVMITGRGNILKAPKALNDSSTPPLFEAVALYDNNQKTFLLNLGVFYEKPEGTGDLVDLSATSELYVNLAEKRDWHFYMGEDTPEDRRVRADIAHFLQANAYFMVVPDKVSFGSKIGYDSGQKWKFGPLRVHLASLMNFDVKLSRRPSHATGNANLSGTIGLKAFKVGVEMCANADLAYESPTPFLLRGEFTVRLETPKFIPDPEATVTLEWSKARTIEAPESLVQSAQIDDPLTNAGMPVEATTSAISSGDVCPPVSTPGCKVPLVPIYAKPTIAFARNVNDLTATPAARFPDKPAGFVETIGSGNTGGTWTFNATGLHWRSIARAPGVGVATSLASTLTELPTVFGAWLPKPPASGPRDANALTLWSRTAFSYTATPNYLFYPAPDDPNPDWSTGVLTPAECNAYQPNPRYTEDHAEGSLMAYACNLPPIATGEDLILPSYNAFALQLTTEGLATGASPGLASTTNTVNFRTAGPPFDLAPLIAYTIPERPDRPHYRADLIGLRFNQPWMDLAYRGLEPSRAAGASGTPQRLVFRIVDANDQPARDAAGTAQRIYSVWLPIPGHVANRADEDLLKYMSGTGIRPSAQNDDAVYGLIADWQALKPDTQYTIEVWYVDSRIAALDERVTDADWLKKNVLRAYNANKSAVMLYQFPMHTSKYGSFADLTATYSGGWWPLTASAYSLPTLLAKIAPVAPRAGFLSGSLGNGDIPKLARYLALAEPDADPDSVRDAALLDMLGRIANYTGDASQLGDSKPLRDEWKADAALFSELDDFLGLKRLREPAPTEIEVTAVLDSGGSQIKRALVLEFPEAVDWSRVKFELVGHNANNTLTTETPLTIFDRTARRVLVFRPAGASFLNERYDVKLAYSRVAGPHNPVLLDRTLTVTPTPLLSVDLSLAALLGETRP